ncbi:LLM class oxidoreductase [Paraburkholderia youngii]
MDMSAITAIKASAPIEPALSEQPAWRRVFREGALTVGLILPLETHPDSPFPTMRDHVAMAQRAESMGVAALWMRDIPFYDPAYGDAGQIFEPLVYIASLAAVTSEVALGTTGIVLPMRDPLLLAKQVNSLDQLTNGRLLLGMSSGDRPSEYPVFGIDFDTRGERFRDAFQTYRTVGEQPFPVFSSLRFGKSDGTLDMLPKPQYGRIPAIAVGRAQQSLEWIAAHMDGYLGFVPRPDALDAFVRGWNEHVAHSMGREAFKPIAFGGYLYLHPRPDYPFRTIRGGFVIGSRSLRYFLEQAREAGVSHVALNPKVTPRPYADVLDELHSEVLPYFIPEVSHATREHT